METPSGNFSIYLDMPAFEDERHLMLNMMEIY